MLKVSVMKRSSKKNTGYICAGILALIAVCVIVALLVVKCSSDDGQIQPPGQENDESHIMLGSGLKLTLVGEYDGVFFEDGSNEEINNALAIVLCNENSSDLQYAEVFLDYGDFTASFTATNIPSGQSVLLLEKNKTLSLEKLPDDYRLGNVTFFKEKMSVCDDVFTVSGTDGYLHVTNISDKDITSDVVISYKNYANDMFYGGITYRITVSGGIKARQTVQSKAGHFSPASSKVLTVTEVKK